MATKNQQNGDQIATNSLGEGYLTVNKRLIDCLLKENVGSDYIVGYITLLAMARHQEESTEEGVCHAEVFTTVPELRKLLGMDEKRMRNFTYWLENKNWATKRLINGRRVLLLTQYDQHTCQQKRRAKRVAIPPSAPVVNPDFIDEIVWE